MIDASLLRTADGLVLLIKDGRTVPFKWLFRFRGRSHNSNRLSADTLITIVRRSLLPVCKPRWSRTNIPMKPSPENAERILRLIQEYSKPFGTEMTIKDGVGYIDVADAATVPVGADVRASFDK